MIKMIVTDLDGTLLRDDKTISDFTVRTLQAYREKGVKIVYATARGGSADTMAPKALFDARIIMNGACAYEGGELVYRRLVPMDEARNLLIQCDQYGLKTAADTSSMHYSNFDVTAEWSGSKNYRIVDFNSHSIDAEKLYALVNDEKDIAFMQELLPENLYMTVSRDHLAQVMHKEATKAKAIASVAKRWSVDMSEIAAFGDDLNDLDMLDACGLGIAMENALPQVKANADAICGSNNDDGVAKWLLANL